MDRKRPVRKSFVSDLETEDEESDSEEAKITSNLMNYSCQKRSKNNQGTAVPKNYGSTAADFVPTENHIPTAWWNYGQPRSSKHRTPVVSRRRPLGDRYEGNNERKEDGNLLNVGKTVFSWALGKLGYSTSQAEQGEDKRLGLTFTASGGRDLFHSSILTEENQSIGDGFLASVLNSDLEEGELPADRTGISEDRPSDGFFTPIGSPDVPVRSARPSILSPRSPGGAKSKPRVSINRTPQVREIASRAAQAKDSSLIWEHRDLDETECAGYRVPGDTTPEANGSAYLSSFPTSPSVAEQLDVEMEGPPTLQTPLKSPESNQPLVTPERAFTLSPTSVSLNAVSPSTREGVLALLEFKRREVVREPISGRPPLESFTQVNLTAAQTRPTTFDQAMVSSRYPKRLPVTPKSSRMPVLGGRGSHPLDLSMRLNNVMTGQEKMETARIEKVETPDLREIKLPRLMPRKAYVSHVRPTLLVKRPPIVPVALCRPVEEMLFRAETSRWLPPVFVDDASQWEDETELDEDAELPGGWSGESMEIEELRNRNGISVQCAVSEKTGSATCDTSAVFDDTTRTQRDFSADDVTTGLPARVLLRERTASLVDEIYARLEEKMRKGAEARKPKLNPAGPAVFLSNVDTSQ